MSILILILGIFFSYFLGGIPFGLVFGKLLRGVDIRSQGSGNIGATNVARTIGYHWGALVFLFDGLKGFLPVFLVAPLAAGWAGWTEYEVIFQILFGLFAFLGHVLSPFLHFKGGKGVATATGVLLGLTPLAVLIAFGTWVGIFLAMRIVSVASLAAAVVLPLSHFLLKGSPLSREDQWILFFCIAIGAIVFVRHRSNIGRLVRGEENRFGKKK